MNSGGDPRRRAATASCDGAMIAYGSAKEVDSHLRLLVAAGAINRDLAEDALKLVDLVRAMTWCLVHPAK